MRPTVGAELEPVLSLGKVSLVLSADSLTETKRNPLFNSYRPFSYLSAYRCDKNHFVPFLAWISALLIKL